MQKPSFGEHQFDVGVIVESWRLWQGLQSNEVVEFETISDWRLDVDYFVLKHPSGRRIGVVIAQGASFAVDALERFNGCGAEAVIRIGTCGGISPKLVVGDVVVPYCAIREEGTSAYYLDPKVPALSNYDLSLRTIEKICAATGKIIHPSLAWTTDGRWRQSDEKIRSFSALGVSAVDMETSGLLAAAWQRQISACSVSIVGDTPIHQLGQEFKGVPQSESDWYEKIIATAAICWEPIIQASLSHIDEKED